MIIDFEEEEEFDEELFVDATAIIGPLDRVRLIGGYFVGLHIGGFVNLVKGGGAAALPDVENRVLVVVVVVANDPQLDAEDVADP